MILLEHLCTNALGEMASYISVIELLMQKSKQQDLMDPHNNRNCVMQYQCNSVTYRQEKIILIVLIIKQERKPYRVVSLCMQQIGRIYL